MQHFGEDLSWGVEVQALSWGVIVGVDGSSDVLRVEGLQVSGPGEEAADSADGVFDAAFLPRRVWIAEEGLQAGGLV